MLAPDGRLAEQRDSLRAEHRLEQAAVGPKPVVGASRAWILPGEPVVNGEHLRAGLGHRNFQDGNTAKRHFCE
jgi:hypothetical protein